MTIPRTKPCILHILACCLALPVITGSTTTWAASGSAQPDGEDSAEKTVRLDAQANAAYQAGAYESASGLFSELYETTGDANYLYNLSVCYERMERLPEALQALDDYAAKNPDHDVDAVAAKRRGLLIRIEAAGAEPSASDTRDSDVSKGTPPAPDDPPVEAAEANGRSKPVDIAGGLTLGLGVTAVAVGVGLGLTSNLHKDTVETRCVEEGGGLLCSDAERSDSDSARSFAVGADVSFALGGALAATGIVLLVVNSVRAKKKRGSMSVLPTMGPRRSGLSLSGRF